jgi:hypothetical protein
MAAAELHCLLSETDWGLDWAGLAQQVSHLPWLVFEQAVG